MNLQKGRSDDGVPAASPMIDFVEFRLLQEVGIFSYLVYSLDKSHFNGWGSVEA